jgi:D-serine deaminase-like pyridoxal phosphate-dependent protein
MTLPRPIAPHLPDGLDTPTLVIDLDVVEQNAQRLARAIAEGGLNLRPHVKTHKSIALTRIQLEHGASGITVGTLGEAEVMAAAGINDIFVAYPVWASSAKAPRLRALAERAGLTFAVGLDSREAAQQLARAMVGSHAHLRVVVEVDSNYGRTGTNAATAGELAKHAKDLGLEVVGAFTHGGHGYHDPEARDAAAADEIESLTVAAASLRAEGIEPQVLSAGSSPTATFSARPPVTEIRAGTYLIGDRQQVALGASPPDGVAIAVAATVVSDAALNQFVIDAGAKSLTKDAPPYIPGFGCIPEFQDAVIERVSDYHGQVHYDEGSTVPTLGQVVAVVPNHACPVIDLYDSFLATRSGQVVGRWTVDARGRSS